MRDYWAPDGPVVAGWGVDLNDCTGLAWLNFPMAEAVVIAFDGLNAAEQLVAVVTDLQWCRSKERMLRSDYGRPLSPQQAPQLARVGVALAIAGDYGPVRHEPTQGANISRILSRMDWRSNSATMNGACLRRYSSEMWLSQ